MLEITRSFTSVLEAGSQEPLNFIQVFIDPRRVGKTTGVVAIAEQWSGPLHMESADSPLLSRLPQSWIYRISNHQDSSHS